jgi:lipoprotein signal peptidase
VADEGLACFSLDLDRWHFLDVFYTFYSALVSSAQQLRPGSPVLAHVLVQIGMTAGLKGILWDRFNAVLNVLLWFYVLLVALATTSLVRRRSRRALLRAAIALAVGVVAFGLGNVVDTRSEYRAAAAATAPERSHYWLFHSIWHLCAMTALHALHHTTT